MAITKITTPELFDFSATNTALQLPSGDTASRPSAPSAGEWRYNTEKKYVEYYDGASWFQIDTEALPLPSDFPSQNFNVSTYSGIAATQTIDAKFNEAANFSGAATSNIIIPNNAFPRASANTLAFWVKFANTSDSDKLIFYSYNTSNATRYYIGQAGSYITFRNPDNSSITNVSSSLTANVWAHFAAVSDGAGNYVFYTNGSQSATGSFTNLTDDPTLQKFGDEWKGFLDQTRIYNTNLDATQVNYIYTNETTTTASQLNPSGFPSGCIAAYQLDGDASDVGGTYGGVETDIGYTGLQFQPDFVWIKNRSFANNPQIIDSVRGVTKHLISATADTEQTYTNGLTAFTANGFTVGSLNDVNKDGDKLVAWSLKAGGSSNTFNVDGTGYSTASAAGLDAGDITPTGASANTANGFSIIQYTGNSAASATISHGLSSAPELVIVKAMNLAAGWPTQAPGYFGLRLNDSGGNDTGNGAVFFADTAPTSTVVTVGSTDEVNDGYNYIMYNFHSVDSYQRVGSYAGSGSDTGNYVYTDSNGDGTGTGSFEPAFLLVKRVDTTADWFIYDNKRVYGSEAPANPLDGELRPNRNLAEDDYPGFNFYTNGFEVANAGTNMNASGGTYIYLAIAADEDTSVPTQANSFSPTIYTGNSSTQNIFTPFAPDFTWIKARTATTWHNLQNTITGATKHLYSNATNALDTTANGLVSFNPNGFSLGSANGFNVAQDYISWNWKAGGLPSINISGTIKSVESLNSAAGFSIVRYVATTGTQTVGHNLGGIPEMIIQKKTSGAENWYVYFPPGVIDANYNYMILNAFDPIATTSSTAPTATTFNPVSTSGTYISYLFRSISTYQKIGTYTGQSTSTVTVSLDFTPSFVMIKDTSGNDYWTVWDTARSPSNNRQAILYWDLFEAEANSASNYIQINTDEFVTNPGTVANTNGNLYVYLAIA